MPRFPAWSSPFRCHTLLTASALALVMACGSSEDGPPVDDPTGASSGGAAGTGGNVASSSTVGTGGDAGMGGDGGGPAEVVAELTVDDQALASPFDALEVTAAMVPAGTATGAEVRIYKHDGDDAGTLLGSAVLTSGTNHEELDVSLSDRLVGVQNLRVELVDSDGSALVDHSGDPVQNVISVTGDMEEPVLTMNDHFIGGVGHRMPPSYDETPEAGPEFTTPDRYTLEVGHVHVPERYTQGLYLAVYASDNGAPTGSSLGRLKYTTAGPVNPPLTVASEIDLGRNLVAVLRETSASGNWNQNAPIVTDLQGQPMVQEFSVDSLEFRNVLELDDQRVEDNDGPNPANPNRKIKVRYANIANEHSLTQGLQLGIYADSGGNPGALLGYGKFINTGEHVDTIIELDSAVSGQQTLHAALRVSQAWDPAAPVALDHNGDEMWRTFEVGGAALSYIDNTPYTSVDPRIIRLEKAYSHDGPAWIVLARDDNGSPGEYIAVKRVLPKFQGNVWFHKSETDVEGDGIGDNGLQERGWFQEGTTQGYLTESDPDAFRSSMRGDENLHVLMFQDQGEQMSWEWREGGHPLQPVLENGATGDPVTARFQVTMEASIENSQKDSDRYYLPCSALSQHYNNPTELPVDCRCNVDVVGLNFPECKEAIASGLDMSFGTGPRVEHLNYGRFRSGFVETDTNELIALAVWKDHTTYWPENGITIDVAAVMAIDPETRERRLIGGRYDDPDSGIIDIGTGPVLSKPFQIQKGPDGNYYIAGLGYVRIGASLTPTVDIIRMDPSTGNREYVWRSNHLGFNFDDAPNPYGHCANGRTAKFGYYSVQVGRKAFAIDESGNFYLSSAHNGNTPTSDGISILQITPDGASCNFITRTKVGQDNVLYSGQSIGTGPEPQAGPYHGLLAKDGKLYTTTEITDELWEVDIATGNRKALHIYGVDDFNRGSNGTHITWDHHRNLIWQMGFANTTLLYDPEADTSEPLWCADNYRYFYGNPKDGSGNAYDLSGVPASVDVDQGRDVVPAEIRNHLIRCMKPSAWGNNGFVLERGMWMHPTNPRFMFLVNSSMIIRADLVAGTSEIFSY